MRLALWLIGGGIVVLLGILASAWSYARLKKLDDSTAGWDVDTTRGFEQELPERPPE